MLISSPFLIVRTVYGLLQVIFQNNQRKWNPVYGSAVLFAMMALLMEYIAMGVFFYNGFSMPPEREKPQQLEREIYE